MRDEIDGKGMRHFLATRTNTAAGRFMCVRQATSSSSAFRVRRLIGRCSPRVGALQPVPADPGVGEDVGLWGQLQLLSLPRYGGFGGVFDLGERMASLGSSALSARSSGQQRLICAPRTLQENLEGSLEALESLEGPWRGSGGALFGAAAALASFLPPDLSGWRRLTVVPANEYPPRKLPDPYQAPRQMLGHQNQSVTKSLVRQSKRGPPNTPATEAIPALSSHDAGSGTSNGTRRGVPRRTAMGSLGVRMSVSFSDRPISTKPGAGGPRPSSKMRGGVDNIYDFDSCTICSQRYPLIRIWLQTGTLDMPACGFLSHIARALSPPTLTS